MPLKVLVLAIGCLLVGCGGGEESTDTGLTLLYSSPVQYDWETFPVDGVEYIDVLGEQRAVNVLVYRPVDAPMPAPIVLLSHGGSAGKTDPNSVLPAWAKMLASNGYVVVAIAHPKRPADSYEALCKYLGVIPDIQCALKINWERPHDVTRVLDWLEDKSQAEAWSQVYDLTRVAHLGHSAGAGCGMMLAGAPRNYVCAQPFGKGQGTVVPCDEADWVEKSDARVKAILAFSNQGPGQDGFMASSFASIEGPILIGTGAADGSDDEPATRVQAFELLEPSPSEKNRFLLYIDEPGAVHTLFSADLDACTKISGESRCQAMRARLYAAALAFLDYELKGLSPAGTWLQGDGPTAGSQGVVSWTAK